MSEKTDEQTGEILSSYLKAVRSLPNESAKTHRFLALVGELFPGNRVTTQLSAGIEKRVRIDTAKGEKRGRIDSYYGNAVIEFENSLAATGSTAEKQLREYISGVWAEEKGSYRPLIGVASDGIVWRIYRPTLKTSVKSKPKAEDVELELLRELTLTDKTLGDFWIWLTSFLFRPGNTLPTAEQFRVDFGVASLAFHDGIDALNTAWRIAQKESEPRLAFETWEKYLTVTYGRLVPTQKEGEAESGEADLPVLFLKHTYLASVARFLIWASISKGRVKEPLRDVARGVLSGEFFASQRLANLVEDDFFQWVRRPQVEEILAPVWERILAQILTYDLSRLNEDVLKGVYQELVDPKDRHDLGEYYTPDWLCERIVQELLPKKGYASVLDPTCGSGSFLRAAITHLLRSNPGGSDTVRLQNIVTNVVGIDIHPLAVMIAKATYLLALGPLVKAAKQAVQIPVYLADSLFLPAEVSQMKLGEAPGYEIRFGGKKVSIPDDLINNAELFDPAISACAKVAADHATSGRENSESLSAFLKNVLPTLSKREDCGVIISSLWHFTEALADLIRTKKNSIWAFIIQNSYRPSMLKSRFDFIVGNPPWLSYRYISDPEYQEEVKRRAIAEYGIAPPHQKLVTQMELATVFLAHALKIYGRPGAKLGFVMPRSVLTADQHMNLRLRSYRAPFRLLGYWDLKEVRPIFQVPCCVLLAGRDESKGSVSDILPVLEWTGQLPSRDVPWETAQQTLTFNKTEGQVIFLGDRTAFSTTEGRSAPSRTSPYKSAFRQGATILPRNFYFVKSAEPLERPDPDQLYWVETDLDQAEDAKPPYQDVHMKGSVEGRFLYCTALSRHVLPFLMLPPALIAIPVEREEDHFRVTTAENLRKQGFRGIAKWMMKVEEIWEEKRGDKADRQSIYERLDYQKELTVQSVSSRYLVLYNAAGTNLSAVALDRNHLPISFIVEHKLYWAPCSSEQEADYLTAILNSDSINIAIKPFQSTGLMGERDIEKKVLDLPFPSFNPEMQKHRDLASLGGQAKTKAAAYVSSTLMPNSLAKRRAMVRDHLGSIMGEIDNLVKTMI